MRSKEKGKKTSGSLWKTRLEKKTQGWEESAIWEGRRSNDRLRPFGKGLELDFPKQTVWKVSSFCCLAGQYFHDLQNPQNKKKKFIALQERHQKHSYSSALFLDSAQIIKTVLLNKCALMIIKLIS